MNYHKRPSENGYEIFSSDGGCWDLANLGVWTYFGLSREIAEMIVKGFPKYCRESGLAAYENRHPDAIAKEHRKKSLVWLAGDRTLQAYTNNDNPFAELYRRRQDIAMGGPFHDAENPLAGTQFESVMEERRQAYFDKHGEPIEVPQKEWIEHACHLFDQLVERLPDQTSAPSVQSTPKQSHTSGVPPATDGGLKLLSQEDLEPLRAFSANQPIQWGPLFYPLSMVNRTHFCAVGATNSGKTSILRLLFQSIHRNLGANSHFVVYDAKCELLPFLYPPEFVAQSPSQEQFDSAFYLLNPYDARSTPWDIAQDAEDDETARGIAEALFPDIDAKDEAYFGPAVRDLAIAAMRALRKKADGPHWTFCQFICSLLPDNLKTVLDTTDWGKSLYEDYLGKKTESSDSTRKVLRARYSSLVGPAFAWQQSKRKPLSLREWAAGDCKSVVLSSLALYGKGLDRLNRLLLGVLCRNLDVIDSPLHTYLYLDEFENLDYVEWIVKLAKQGISKRVHLALCMHDINSLRLKYGLQTEGLISNCGFWAFLQTNDPVTTQWASSVMGEPQQQRTSHTEHYGDDSSSTSTTSTTSTRQPDPLVLAADVQGLPTPLTRDEITAYFADPYHVRYRGTLPFGSWDATRTEGSQNPNALWPMCDRVSKFSKLPKTPSIPEDTFYPLYQLGFHRDDYTPPQDIAVRGESNEDGLEDREDKSRRTVSVTVNKDVRFNFPLDD